jgi:hypothetical protein
MSISVRSRMAGEHSRVGTMRLEAMPIILNARRRDAEI